MPLVLRINTDNIASQMTVFSLQIRNKSVLILFTELRSVFICSICSIRVPAHKVLGHFINSGFKPDPSAMLRTIG
jgi:hypothetical protein